MKTIRYETKEASFYFEFQDVDQILRRFAYECNVQEAAKHKSD